MNKVFSINLGGIPVTIDDDAYSILENYLQSLHNHFKQGDGYEEIIYDIENRMGELLKQGLEGRAIANTQDVKNAISVMGKPEDFGATPVEPGTKSNFTGGNSSQQSSSKASETTGKSFKFNTGKRLMRNPDDKVVSGVCSGLSAYLGFEDPIYIRIAFLLLLFAGGSSFMAYFILLILMPKALTTADKLAMRGEPVDVNSIAGEVSKNLGDRMNEVGNSLNDKLFSKHNNGITKIITALATLLMGSIKFFVIFILVVLAIAFISAWLSISVGYFAALPYANLLVNNSTVITASTVNIFFLVAVPLLAIILFLRRILFKKSSSIGINIALVGIFLINLFSLVFFASSTAKDFSKKDSRTEDVIIPVVNNTVSLVGEPKKAGESDEFNIGIHIEGANFNENGFIIEQVPFSIKRSTDNAFHLTKKLSARGRNTDDANSNLQKIVYNTTLVGNAVKLPRAYEIPKGNLWRNQRVELTLFVPEGKYFTLDKQLQNVANVSLEEGDINILPECDNTIHTWKMTKDGIVCVTSKELESL